MSLKAPKRRRREEVDETEPISVPDRYRKEAEASDPDDDVEIPIDEDDDDVERVEAELAEEMREDSAALALGGAVKYIPISAKEKEICARLRVHQNPVDYLRFELGWTVMEIRTFLTRNNIREELAFLERAYNNREAIQERTAFLSQLKLNAMVPASINILARALRGDVPDRETGEIQRAPTRNQMDAALEVLDRTAVKRKESTGDKMGTVDARSVSIYLGDKSDDLTRSDKASRERVRKLISGIVGDLNAKGPKKKKRKRRTVKS